MTPSVSQPSAASQSENVHTFSSTEEQVPHGERPSSAENPLLAFLGNLVALAARRASGRTVLTADDVRAAQEVLQASRHPQ